MDISHGAIHGTGRNLERFNDGRGIHISHRPGKDTAVSSILKEDRSPSDLKVHAYLKVKIGLAEGLDKTGLGFNEVGVLLAFGKDRH
jgi:hypothetical protein